MDSNKTILTERSIIICRVNYCEKEFFTFTSSCLYIKLIKNYWRSNLKSSLHYPKNKVGQNENIHVKLYTLTLKKQELTYKNYIYIYIVFIISQ